MTRRWDFRTEGCATPSLYIRLEEGWEPIGVVNDSVALRREVSVSTWGIAEARNPRTTARIVRRELDRLAARARPAARPRQLDAMSQRRLLVLVSALWAAATLTVGFAGLTYGWAHRYDHCRRAFVGSTLAWVCPIGEFRERPPASSPTA